MYKPDQYGSYRGYGCDLGKEVHTGSKTKRFSFNYSWSGIWLNV